ncbi:MAG: transporter [Betaproteobacteria bacterium]|nr:transporter [Betaproteobacteria bacterium]
MKCFVTAFGCVALLPTLACAFQPLVTDDTGTQGAGGNQVEAAYNRTVDKAPGERSVTHEVPLVFTRGITDALDLFVGIAHQRFVPDAPATTERGWGNTAFGAKWRFYENEARKLSFALKPEVQIPVSRAKEARGLGTARASYGAGLLMTQEVGFGAVHANAAVERVNYADDALNAGERRTLYRLSVAPVWDVAEGWKLALDAGLITNPDPTARARLGYVELGAIYAPTEDLDIALGIIRNFRDGSATTTQATIGLTWRFR